MPDVFDGRYVAIVVTMAGPGSDMLGQVYRDPPGPWKIAYRFRYYVDDKVLDSDDEKHPYWWQCSSNVDEAKACGAMLELCKGLEAFDYGKLDVVEIRSDRVEDFFKKLSGRPWFHAKMEDAPS